MAMLAFQTVRLHSECIMPIKRMNISAVYIRDTQDKLRKKIQRVITEHHDGELDYRDHIEGSDLKGLKRHCTCTKSSLL